MKVVVIGCTHAGTSAIINITKLYPECKVTVYERNSTISFLSCGIALYVGGVVKDAQSLFYSSPEKLNELGVSTKMNHSIEDVDFNEKVLKVKNLLTNEIFTDSYDKLIITTGSWPIVPKIEGINFENILLSKNYDHSKEIVEKSKSSKNIVVVGAGYIGVELAEAFRQYGKNVRLIDSQPRILNKYLDEEFTKIAEENLKENGIEISLNETVVRFEGKDSKVTKVITSNNEYDADLVILSIGFRPNTNLFKDKLSMLNNGAIIVDKFMSTSQKDVFAAGDCCGVFYNPNGKYEYIPLATNAIRMGTLIAKNLIEPTFEYMGTQATSGIKIFDYCIAASGLTFESATENGYSAKQVILEDNYRPEFMPSNEKVLLKIVYDKKTRRILGAQILSKVDMTQCMNTISVCIQNRMTIDQLAFVDFFFQPHFDKPWNILNIAALNAE